MRTTWIDKPTLRDNFECGHAQIDICIGKIFFLIFLFSNAFQNIQSHCVKKQKKIVIGSQYDFKLKRWKKWKKTLEALLNNSGTISEWVLLLKEFNCLSLLVRHWKNNSFPIFFGFASFKFFLIQKLIDSNWNFHNHETFTSNFNRIFVTVGGTHAPNYWHGSILYLKTYL